MGELIVRDIHGTPASPLERSFRRWVAALAFKQLCWWSQSYTLDRALKRHTVLYINLQENKRDRECMALCKKFGLIFRYLPIHYIVWPLRNPSK